MRCFAESPLGAHQDRQSVIRGCICEQKESCRSSSGCPREWDWIGWKHSWRRHVWDAASSSFAMSRKDHGSHYNVIKIWVRHIECLFLFTGSGIRGAGKSLQWSTKESWFTFSHGQSCPFYQQHCWSPPKLLRPMLLPALSGNIHIRLAH